MKLISDEEVDLSVTVATTVIDLNKMSSSLKASEKWKTTRLLRLLILIFSR